MDKEEFCDAYITWFPENEERYREHKREFPHICKSESKFLNFAVAFTSYKLAFTFASEQKQANFSMKFTCRRYSPQFSGQR